MMIGSARGSRRSAKNLARSLAGLLGFVVLTSVTFAQSPTFPALTGRVVDGANILDAAARSALTEKLAALEAKTSDQVVVVTLKSLQGQTIESFGYQLGRHWGIGQKGKNNGVLLIVAPNEHKVRIEVGYGLEGTLTDALTKVIIENAITPRFRANDYAGGITRGVDDVIQVLSGDAELFKQQTAAKEALRKHPSDNWYALLFTLFWVGLLAFIVFVILQAPRRGRRGNVWLLPIPGRGDQSWSSGSSGGFSDSGFSSGGFSGGGGDFGGGGSSGSW